MTGQGSNPQNMDTEFVSHCTY